MLFHTNKLRRGSWLQCRFKKVVRTFFSFIFFEINTFKATFAHTFPNCMLDPTFFGDQSIREAILIKLIKILINKYLHDQNHFD